MPTIHKIVLDAKEYNQQLAAVVSRTKAAQAEIEGSSLSSGTAGKPAEDVRASKMADRELTLNVTGNFQEKTEEAARAMDMLTDRTVELNITGNAAEKAKEVSQAVQNIPAHQEVSLDVVAHTVEVARLKDQIAQLEAKEIDIQTKVVDKDIALLQKDLDAIRNKDIRITTEADSKQAEELQQIIASLQDKKIRIRTEVRSKELDQLRNNLKQTEKGVGRFGQIWKKLKSNIPGEISKGAGAIEAVGSAAGSSIPQVSALGGVIDALLSPIALVMAAITALVAIGTAVWDKLTISAEEYGETARRASEEAQRELEKTQEQNAAADEYMNRLKDLNSSDIQGNHAKQETIQLLSVMQSRYGALGAEIDATSGKITNLAAVEARLNQQRNSRLAAKFDQHADAAMEEAKAAYMKAKGEEWFTSESRAGEIFENLKLWNTPENILKEMESISKNATTLEDKQNYGAVADKLRAVVEAREKARNLQQMGYENTDQRDQAVARRNALVNQAVQEKQAKSKRFLEQKSDEAFGDLSDINVKKANRQTRLDYEIQQEKNLMRELAAAREGVQQIPGLEAGERNLEAEAASRKNIADIESRLLDVQAKKHSLLRQIAQLDKDRQAAVDKLHGQAEYELQYNQALMDGNFKLARRLKINKELNDQNLQLTDSEKNKLIRQREALEAQEVDKIKRQAEEEMRYNQAILAGDYDKAARMRLEINLREKNLQLTAAEKEALLEKQRVMNSMKLSGNLKNQAFTMYGKVREMQGQGREFALEKALKEAEVAKGGKLTEAEIKKVRKLSMLGMSLDKLTEGRAAGVHGDLSVKTNSLTSRGGFATGGKVMDTSKIARENLRHNKRQADSLARIQTTLEAMWRD